jgi:hypothetical protein
MLRLMVVWSALLGVNSSDVGAPSADDLKAYQDARAKVGRDADGQVQLALWCEAHGLTVERLKHLTTAMVIDPAHPVARALSGFVKDGATWRKSEAMTDRHVADAEAAPKLNEYAERRARTPDTADGHWNLAQWCQKQGLHDESRAHLWNVLRLDPKREAAWKQLGYKKVGNRWVSDEQVAIEKAEAHAQSKADQVWKPRLEMWKGWLATKGKKADAEQRFSAVTDPRSVRSVVEVFAHGNAETQSVAVQLLGQIQTVASSRALVVLSVSGKSPNVRRASAETLAQRDARESVSLLIAGLRKPLKYEVKAINGPDSPGVLFVEGEKFNLRRFYTIPRIWNPRALDVIANSPDQSGAQSALARIMTGTDVVFPSYPGFSPNVAFWQGMGNSTASGGRPKGPAVPMQPGTSVAGAPLAATELRQDASLQTGIATVQRNVAEYRTVVASAQQQLANDVAAVEAENAAIQDLDERVLPTLEILTGQHLGSDPDAWSSWWADQQGYVYQTPTKPTFEQTIPPSHMWANTALGLSCFAAGTFVNTISGPRPIESIRVGDRLLSQDARTGSLSFEPVVRVFHNRPNKTLRIRLGEESIVATPIHRFWKAGVGWAMARELKPGDIIRTAGSVAKVESIETGGVQPVFNLELAERHSFFVGTYGALVHDNSLVQPVAEPFDAAKPKPETRASAE